MSSCIDFMPSEQLCYIPCNFCSIVLAVSVPLSSLFDMVTVRCGRCTQLWSVNMAAAFHSFSLQDVQAPNYLNQQDNRNDLFGSSSNKHLINNVNSNSNNNKISVHAPHTNNAITQRRAIKSPPEKRQRVPSAYNQFIREEIQRIKANNPDISHREAFSTAAKNWAHFPHIHFGLMLENNNKAKLDEVSEKQISRPPLLSE